jgi:DnaJ-domain-containing protein 1
MSTRELLTVLVCVIAGYAIVHSLINRKPARPAPADRDAPRPEPAQLSCYQVLGVSPEASREEISAAYKRKIAQYHPDKVASMGAEIREVAEAKSREINAAYESALRRFG